MSKIILDALIPREDFEASTGAEQSSSSSTIQIRDLEQESFFYNTVRKPDFQRETSEWDEFKIAEFVKSFLNGDLIPSVILWNSGTNVFVIDGAHRLSAMISWVNDDYGDGVISKTFYGHTIPDEQILTAQKTRRKIEKEISSYKEHQHAIKFPEKADTVILERAKRLASLAIQLQWVKGNAEKAEQSFFKINQHAAPINDTELRLLKARKKPNAIAARAIIRSGGGHKYWSKFDEKIRAEIEELAKEINQLLFIPKLKNPIKTLDIPIGGKGYSKQSLPMILDTINIVNNVKDETKLDNDDTGEETIQYLKETRRTLRRITGTHPSSLGLHPAVYFYSATGRYQITPFLGFIELIKEYEVSNKWKEFSGIRSQFENFLIENKVIVKHINYKYGSGLKSYLRFHTLISWIIDLMVEGKKNKDVIELIEADSTYDYIKFEEATESTEKSEFSSSTKSATFLNEAIQKALKCKLCQGLIHVNSISTDHITRKEDGGKGNPENAQLTHLYCNTTLKN